MEKYSLNLPRPKQKRGEPVRSGYRYDGRRWVEATPGTVLRNPYQYGWQPKTLAHDSAAWCAGETSEEG